MESGRRWLIRAALVAGCWVPRGDVAAQTLTPSVAGRDVVIRLDGPVQIAASDTGWSVVVVNDTATVAGLLRGSLIVVNGTARVSGAVEGAVIVVNGRAELTETARLAQDLVLYRSAVDRRPGAAVGGDVIEERGLTFGRQFLIWLWVGSTLVLLVAAALFAAIGGRLLTHATTLLAAVPGRATLTALITWIGVPILAGAATLTVIGVPLAVALLVVLMPALWLLGYLVVSAWLGSRLVPLLGARDDPERPYGAATLGVLAAQVIGLIPLLGGLAVLLAGVLGAGTLVYLALDHWRHPREAPVELASE